jgi:dTDP-4-dehydrorhamnose reductase
MKVLITGSNGMLGSNLLKTLPFKNIGYNSKDLDITDLITCKKVLEKEKPDIIIHTAAYTDVDDCEVNPDKAYNINTIGTQNLVNYCINKNILFVFISSTGIYGNKKEKTPYTEFDEVTPTTFHHKSKYEAEKIVQNHLSKYLILRTGWLFGGNKTHRKNFVYKRYLESLIDKEIYSDDSQIGNPTYIEDFIKQIEILINNNLFGTFNCVNEAKNISRYTYVKQIIKFFSQNCEVKIASSDMYKRIAPVSKNESALNYKLNLLNLNIMGSWNDALERYISKLKKELT